MKSYWATSDDPVFETGHYVEEWEIRRLSQMSESVKELVRAQTDAGNRIRSITERSVELAMPLRTAVLALPAGLAFWTPFARGQFQFFDGDEDGVVSCLATGVRVYPTGYELVHPYAPATESPPSAA